MFKHSIGPIHRIDSRVIISNKVIFGIIFLCTTCYWIPPSLFAQALGQKVKKNRAGSSLASVFHASGAEAWQSLPWLYLGLTIRFFWWKMHTPECLCMEGGVCCS